MQFRWLSVKKNEKNEKITKQALRMLHALRMLQHQFLHIMNNLKQIRPPNFKTVHHTTMFYHSKNQNNKK